MRLAFRTTPRVLVVALSFCLGCGVDSDRSKPSDGQRSARSRLLSDKLTEFFRVFERDVIHLGFPERTIESTADVNNRSVVLEGPGGKDFRIQQFDVRRCTPSDAEAMFRALHDRLVAQAEGLRCVVSQGPDAEPLFPSFGFRYKNGPNSGVVSGSIVLKEAAKPGEAAPLYKVTVKVEEVFGTPAPEEPKRASPLPSE